ncbi:putative thiazole-containing bacteriocin maturation protein [Paenibacillus selenitireducens]|uniref:Putative thiazole-containing bacteriocin maturation protein n=1 Tax=Paenibacillus selenitireducens TaxID=1324314 RepID=A0A1T2X169_9BACL|nr:putative thiazole-containing bacteriocin maturation protein [Paenibacillus selenitireducens]OPA73634.1 putative thiazole-containing bacteriocin maturation protein [Paenibacillus selenitireducens]
MNPSMRLKVKGDTFFLPDSNGGIYFRNNTGSFRMEGDMIDQWIEKLMPMWSGDFSMADLTNGLPEPHRVRVYEIAEVLLSNGFVRDTSQDHPHSLPEAVERKYAAQIEFLDSFDGSGAHRFQTYRQANPIAVGSGPIFVSLVAALLESGLPRFRMLITNVATTDRQRISELTATARLSDLEIEVEEIFPSNDGFLNWPEVVRLADSVLYVAQDDDPEELRALHAACRDANKLLLPAIYLRQAGIAGPMVHPDSDVCFESAWRRIHRTALGDADRPTVVSTTPEAMLANVVVFEWLKTVTGTTASELTGKLFLLNPETLEGEWHSLLPHPLVRGLRPPEPMDPFDLPIDQRTERQETDRLLSYFNRLTSAETGILHCWEEGDSKQLPLSQCRVQAVDPLSEGPAELLPQIVCSGMTHHEARKEAGLAGIEAYVSRLSGVLKAAIPVQPDSASPLESPTHEYVGIGAGETVAEAVYRGLRKCLFEELKSRSESSLPSVHRVKLSKVEDDICSYCLRALSTMQDAPVIGLGQEAAGFPVVWVGTNGYWYGGVGVNRTMALREALRQALMKTQNETADIQGQILECSLVKLEDALPQSLTIPGFDESEYGMTLQSVRQILQRNRKRIAVVDLSTEPFMKEELAGVFGVSLREEETH